MGKPILIQQYFRKENLIRPMICVLLGLLKLSQLSASSHPPQRITCVPTYNKLIMEEESYPIPYKTKDKQRQTTNSLPMAQFSTSPSPPSANPQPINAPIISPHFCASYPVDLSIVRKLKTIGDSDFLVTDINGNIIFKEKGSGLHSNRVLLDAAGNPIITLRPKLMTAHDRWHVFRGESTDSSDLIFTVKRSSMFQCKTKLDVFLANNTDEKVCDFKVQGTWSERSCVVYAGQSSSIVAQMQKKSTIKNMLIGKDNFMVTVYPNVDYGFIVALIVILTTINDVAQEAAVTGAVASASAVSTC